MVGSSESNGSYHFLILFEILRNEPICQNETANFGPTGSSRGGTFYSAFPFHFQPKFTEFLGIMERLRVLNTVCG